MKKIVFICASLNIGGCEKAFVNLANLLSCNDFQCDFLLSHKGGILTSLLNKGCNIYYTNKRMLLSAHLIRKFLIKNNYNFSISGPSWTNIIVLKATKNLSIKTIVTHHNLKSLDTSYKIIGGLWNYFCNKYYSKAYKIIAVSNAIKQYLLTYKKINNVEVVYNSINISMVEENIKEQKEIIMQYNLDKYFIAIGRLSPEKNISMLIEAYSIFRKKYKNIKLLIVGDGGDYGALQLLTSTKKLSKNIIFVGNIQNPYYLLSQSVALLQSSFTEALPTVLIEAILLGKNIVSTPTSGAEEILNKGKYGFISKDFSKDSFCKTMETVIESPIKNILLSERAKDFSPDIVLQKYKEVLSC